VEVKIVRLGEYIRLAFSEIFHNKARTFLTLLGIIIGIAAVIIIIFVVQGAQTYIMSEIEKIAPVDILQVYPDWDPDTGQPLGNITMADVNYLEEQLGNNIKALAPRYWNSGELRYKENSYDCDLIPTTPAFQQLYDLKIEEGRFLSEMDVENFQPVIVLGYETAENLFEEEKAVGKKVRLYGITFTVIGVLPKDYQSPIIPVSTNDNRGFIPISVMERLGGFKDRFSLIVRARNDNLVPHVKQRIIELLNERHSLTTDGRPKFRVYDMTGDLQILDIIKIVLMVLLGGVASITLLVAGIGVMNIMLVIVAERTKEIGLRKALGATRRDIMIQFIIESVVLCLFGGILGILTGYLGSEFTLNLANRFIDLQAEVPGWAIIISLIFTTGVGLFFGIYPALKAARLDPIVALHYE